MSGRGSERSHVSSRSGGKGRDPIFEQDAWYQGRDTYREDQRRREDAMYRGNAWQEYKTPMQRGMRRIYTVRGDSGSPVRSDDQYEHEYGDQQQRPRKPLLEPVDRRPRPGRRAGGADSYNLNSSDDELHTQASAPSWLSRDDRSVDTMQKRERDRLRRVVIGSTHTETR